MRSHQQYSPVIQCYSYWATGDYAWLHIQPLTISEVFSAPSIGNSGLRNNCIESPLSTTSPAVVPKGKNSPTGMQFASME